MINIFFCFICTSFSFKSYSNANNSKLFLFIYEIRQSSFGDILTSNRSLIEGLRGTYTGTYLLTHLLYIQNDAFTIYVDFLHTNTKEIVKINQYRQIVNFSLDDFIILLFSRKLILKNKL